MKKSPRSNHKKNGLSFKFPGFIKLPGKTGQWSVGIALLAVALMAALGFFDMAGMAGNWIIGVFKLATGKAVFAWPG